MKSLIWQSVMWRPGKARFLIDMKNPLPIRPAPTARQHGPLRGRAVRQIRDVSRATPSLRHASGDTFSSRLTRASHPDRRAAGEPDYGGSTILGGTLDVSTLSSYPTYSYVFVPGSGGSVASLSPNTTYWVVIGH